MSQCTGTSKKTGEQCAGFAVHGENLCAGHLGRGVAAGGDVAREAQRQGAARRSAMLQERKRRPQDVYAEALNAHAEAMSERLVKIATDQASSDADALRAIEALNSRVLGRPRELLETVTKPEEVQRMEEMTDAELWAALEASRQAWREVRSTPDE